MIRGRRLREICNNVTIIFKMDQGWLMWGREIGGNCCCPILLDMMKARTLDKLRLLNISEGFGIDGMGSGEDKVDHCFPLCQHGKIVDG